MDNYYTVKEVAEKLHISEQTVRNHIKKGNIEAFAIGEGWRIPESEITKFIEKNKVKGE